jgi:adenine-specific DNA-methyltransferase
MTTDEKGNPAAVPTGWRPFQLVSLTTGGYRPNTTIEYDFEGRTYHHGEGDGIEDSGVGAEVHGSFVDRMVKVLRRSPVLMPGDLLKTTRASQSFSVCGSPEDRLGKVKGRKDAPDRYEVELLGLDVFDPATMETEHRSGDDVPAWLLDTDYNGLCFHVGQAFFPRTAAWDDLKHALKGEFEDAVWDHLAGTVSAPFDPVDHRQIAVKVVDDRGNELLFVKALAEAEG